MILRALRRVAENREAARKSRLRKKAYVQQLESRRMKLNHLKQELQRVRKQFPHDHVKRRSKTMTRNNSVEFGFLNLGEETKVPEIFTLTVNALHALRQGWNATVGSSRNWT